MWRTSYNKERAKDIVTLIANKKSKFFKSNKLTTKYTPQQIGHCAPFLKEMNLIEVYNVNTRNNVYTRNFNPEELPQILEDIDAFVPKVLNG